MTRQQKINEARRDELLWWRAKMAVVAGLAKWVNEDDPMQPSFAMPPWVAADLLGVSRPRVKQLLDAGILQHGDCRSARRVGAGCGWQAGVTESSVWRRMGLPFQLPDEKILRRKSEVRFSLISRARSERERARHKQKRRQAGVF